MQLSWPGAGRCSRESRRSSTSINDGLNTLQFQSLSISPHDSKIRQGGTQDNGTWQTNGSKVTWENMMIGDGGQSGFDVAIPEFRFHNFTGASPDVNFNNGNIADWIWTGDPLGQAGRVLRAGDQRPGREQDDVRRHADRVPHQDGGPGQPDGGRGECDL